MLIKCIFPFGYTFLLRFWYKGFLAGMSSNFLTPGFIQLLSGAGAPSPTLCSLCIPPAPVCLLEENDLSRVRGLCFSPPITCTSSSMLLVEGLAKIIFCFEQGKIQDVKVIINLMNMFSKNNLEHTAFVF